MDRREFIRRIVIISVMGVAGASGVYALAEKILATPATTPLLNTRSPPSTTNSAPTTEMNAVTVTTTERSTGGGPANNSSSTSITTNANSSATPTTTNTSSSPPAGYILLAPMSAVSSKTYAYFNHPTFGSSILINYNGTWKAFSAICTHAGCTVDYTSSELFCPCHNGYFSAVDGSVLGGPPPRTLPEYDIKIINGNIYVGNTIIN